MKAAFLMCAVLSRGLLGAPDSSDLGPPTFAFEWDSCSPEVVQGGYEYFEQVLNNFRQAQKEVIIMGWTFSWDTKLFHDPNAPAENGSPTLSTSDLIAEAVSRNVHVYIIFWQNTVSEHVADLAINAHAKELYESHGNVHVLVDTGRGEIGMLFWSAHIKATIFDRGTGFVGGIDLAASRLDTPEHLLPDPRRVPNENNKGADQHGYFEPWQDVMMRVTGTTARDLALLAMERWQTFCESYFVFSGRHNACTADNKLVPDPNMDNFGFVEVTASAIEGIEVDPKISIKARPLGMRAADESASVLLDSQGTQNMTLGTRRDLGVRASVHLTVSVRKSLFHEEVLQQVNIPLVELAAGKDFTYTKHNLKVTLKWIALRSRAVEGNHGCRVLLSGNERWLGSSTVIADVYKEYLEMINRATSSIYIENQYFSSWEGLDRCEGDRALGALLTHPRNTITWAIFDKVVAKAQAREPFSVVVVEPLCANEAESQYTNLRTAKCLYKRLNNHWDVAKSKGNELPSLDDYFGIFNLANVVSHRDVFYLYFIFVHTKVMVIDHDVPGNAGAIVGSANINDRSMLGDGDAEVAVAVNGTFPQTLIKQLLMYHLGANTTPASSLATAMRISAENNVKVLENYHVDWAAGSWGGEGMLFNRTAIRTNRTAIRTKLSEIEATKVGIGEHWLQLPTVDTPQLFQGHLLPYKQAVFGDPWQYRSWTLDNSAAWVQADGSIVPIQQHRRLRSEASSTPKGGGKGGAAG